MPIPYPSEALVRETIQDIIDTVGQDVIINYSLGLILCPVCNGNDPFCPNCGGNKYVYSSDTRTEKANVKWKTLEKKDFTPAGQFPVGTVTVTFLNSPELEEVIRNATSMIITGRTCVIDKWHLQGINKSRIYCICLEDSGKDNKNRVG